jgi:competence protein ComEA
MGGSLDGGIRERLSALSRREVVGLVVLAAVTIGGGALWYLRSLPRPVEVRADGGQGPAPTVSAAQASPVTIFVHVAGRVRRPGVYELAEGSRVIDGIEAAGGARADAYLDGLNLAAVLVDGQQVIVPKRTPGGGGGTAPGPTSTGPALVNLNTASAAELETLPGIGEVIAQAIVDYRTENGPFATVEDLLDVSGIGDATLAEIRDLVTV